MGSRKTALDDPLSRGGKQKNFSIRYVPDIIVLLIMGGLLYYGASWQIFRIYTDAAKYQCYAVAFWQGLSALHALPSDQCAFILHPKIAYISNAAVVHRMQLLGMPAGLIQFVAAQPLGQPLHALPHEYPLLTILPFSGGLIVAAYWYQVAFAVWMILLAAGIYILLRRFRSRKAALACALYLLAGGWATVAGRFDVIPALLTLAALLCAVRGRWHLAFALLALATLYKFYPAILLLPFFIAQQMELQDRWYAPRRWMPLGLFVLLCAVVTGVSFLLSVEGTLGPFTYFSNRPIQVESLSASLVWLSSLIFHQPLRFVFTYGSLNVLSPSAAIFSLLSTILFVAGLAYTCWLQWRVKIDLATATLLTLLIMMLTGKVFSPQYLIWVAPFVAYVGEADRRWLIVWTLIGLLTTLIYPYIYNMSHSLVRVPLIPWFFPATTARNILLLIFVVCLLWYCSRRRPAPRTTIATDLPQPDAQVVSAQRNP
ncbi:MAG TPA: hypothetical protein VKV37_23725 [Ktedonobacteraceae bacterium]|nr:hypothetical protein [Ktedonobacteraceae bacterium]